MKPTIMMLLAALATPACLVETAHDHPTTTTSTLPTTIHAELVEAITTQSAGALEAPTATPRKLPNELRGIETNWSETVAVPAMCADCTLTLIHLNDAATSSIVVLGNDGNELCGITALHGASGGFKILTDSCSARAE